MTRRRQVGGVAVGQQAECFGEGVSDVAEGGVGRFEMALSLDGFGGEAILFGAEKIDGDRAGVVGVKELLPLLADLGQTPALAGDLGLSLLAHPGQGTVELLPHRLRLRGRDHDLAVGVLDGGLDQVDGHVGLLAAGALHPPYAKEVGIAAAVAVGLDQAHPRAAAPAVQRPLQVVVVLSVLLGGVVVGGEDGLGFVEAGFVDQMLVAALVLDPGVADHPHVVGVLEQR